MGLSSRGLCGTPVGDGLVVGVGLGVVVAGVVVVATGVSGGGAPGNAGAEREYTGANEYGNGGDAARHDVPR